MWNFLLLLWISLLSSSVCHVIDDVNDHAFFITAVLTVAVKVLAITSYYNVLYHECFNIVGLNNKKSVHPACLESSSSNSTSLPYSGGEQSLLEEYFDSARKKTAQLTQPNNMPWTNWNLIINFENRTLALHLTGWNEFESHFFV